MNNTAESGLICPHQFYICCSPTLQLVLWCACPDDDAATSTSSWTVVRKQTSWMSFHLMAKRWSCWHDNFCLFSAFQKMLFSHLFSVGHHCDYSLCLQLHKWSKIFGLKNHLSCTHSGPSLLSYHTTSQQYWTPCCVLSWWDVPQHTLPDCRLSCCLPHKVQTFLFHICGAFLWYKHKRIYTLEMGILPHRKSGVLLVCRCDQCVTNWSNFE